MNNQYTHKYDLKVYIFDKLLICYIFFLPVQVMTRFGIRLAISDLFLLPMLLVFCSLHIKKNINPYFLISLYLLSFMFLYGSVISGLKIGTLTQYMYLNKLLGIFVLIITFIMLSSFLSISFDKLLMSIRIFVLSAFLNTLASIILYFLNIEILDVNRFAGRLSGWLLDPNAFGGLLVSSLLLYTPDWLSERRIFSFSKGLFIFLTMTAGIFLTYSRSSYLAFTLGFLFILYMNRKTFFSFTFFLILAGIMLFVSFPLIFGPEFIDRSSLLITRKAQIEARLDYIEQGFNYFVENPIWGLGLGMFSYYENAIIHNTPVWILCEFGIIGITIFSFFIFSILNIFYKEYKISPISTSYIILGSGLAYVLNP